MFIIICISNISTFVIQILLMNHFLRFDDANLNEFLAFYNSFISSGSLLGSTLRGVIVAANVVFIVEYCVEHYAYTNMEFELEPRIRQFLRLQ